MRAPVWATSPGPRGVLGPVGGLAGVSHGAGSTAPRVGPRLFTRALEEGRKPAARAAQGQLWFTQSSPSIPLLPSLATRIPAPLLRWEHWCQACMHGGCTASSSSWAPLAMRAAAGFGMGPASTVRGPVRETVLVVAVAVTLGAAGGLGGCAGPRTGCDPAAKAPPAPRVLRCGRHWGCPAPLYPAPQRGPCLQSHGWWLSPKVPPGQLAGARLPQPPLLFKVQQPTASFPSGG